MLGALLGRPKEWRHGYDLARQTELQSGTLYPILMRLAEQGLLEEAWEEADTAGRPPRHVYRLTASGAAAARELVRDERANARGLRLSRATQR